MNRRTFMKKLMSYLKNISKDERENVENFYNEMFDEQGIGFDDEVPSSFGNPRKIAMEILADDIEIEEKKSKNNGKKKRSFWKKLSLVGLGIFSFPLLVPIFVIAIVCFALWVTFSIIGLLISLFTLPFSMVFNITSVFNWGFRVLCFIILLYAFIWLIKFLYRTLVRDISNNPGKYAKKYVRVKYQPSEDEDYEIYDEDEMDYSNENMDTFFEGIDYIDIDLNALNVKFERSDDELVRVKARNVKRTKLFCEKKGDKLKIYNKGLVGKVNKNGIQIDDEFIKDSTLTIYIPEDVSISGEINATNLRINELELEKFNLQVNAGNVTLNDMEVEYFDVVVNAGNIKGEVEYQEMFKLDVNAGNATLEVEKLYGEIEYEYSVGMGSVRIFEESFSGFGKHGRKNKNSDINMKIKCEAGKVTIR
ncbi:hypothetical protein HMPREF3181_01120 [Parvimonas sp. KA00067]|uniref:DUF4097 family beta strand repeat-containing protein n=1 Tax=Parvimonas sp. KA00067 TaxID=1588755 RepID=UPI0007959C8A|nr:DUF1700 domain-containing protein [Parvimonas sp. KA00067]KXB65676.1 hypothetical protein HMPREF3181_01120 [Parvimonas sp. KA00067]